MKKQIHSEPFRVAKKFRSIAPQDRLRYLQKKESEDYGIRLSFRETWSMRRGFDVNKVEHLGLSAHTLCWCCQNAIAVIRHHVQPISKGGRNKVNNIVPLCNDCHKLVHPHMR